ncbi:MAG: ATP-grasp domain-containing protein, partial [Planctomycetota bacterium]
MKIHEYQAKQILARYGIPVPKSEVAFSVEEAKKGAEALGEGVRVVKAQIHAGGRGKGGGVKVTTSTEQCHEAIESIFGM